MEAASGGEQLPLGSAEASAYLLYTSGSTGEPKAITQSHRNVLHHIASYTNSLHLSAEDRLLLIASWGWTPPCRTSSGPCSMEPRCVPTTCAATNSVPSAQWMAQEEITVFHATPSLYRYFVAALAEQPRRFPQAAPGGLGRRKGCLSDLELYKEHFEPGCLFVNGYGLSESTLSLQCFFDMAYENAGGRFPLAVRWRRPEVLLLNASRRCRAGGEIALASAYLAQGYWRRPELTAAAFLADPKAPGAGSTAPETSAGCCPVA